MTTAHYHVESFVPMTSVGFLLKRCGTLMATVAESRFATEPVTLMQWAVLRKLSDASPMSPGQLSEAMGHDKGALTHLVDALVEAGFVRRERDLSDRRAVQIFLTPAGRQQAESSGHRLVDLLNEVLAPFSLAEVNSMATQLQRLLERLQQVEKRSM